jgi:hypothetical protein
MATTQLTYRTTTIQHGAQISLEYEEAVVSYEYIDDYTWLALIVRAIQI